MVDEEVDAEVAVKEADAEVRVLVGFVHARRKTTWTVTCSGKSCGLLDKTHSSRRAAREAAITHWEGHERADG